MLRHICRRYSTATKHLKNVNVISEALKNEDFFNVKSLVNLRDLFKAKMFIGHNHGCRHENFKDYLFGVRLGVDIIDLDKSLERFHLALNVLSHIVFRGGIVVFVCRENYRFAHQVDRLALQCGETSFTRPFLTGTFSNHIQRFGSNVQLPSVFVFFSVHNSIFELHPAVTESARMTTPSIGIVDSNCDPSLITYPIPGCDDSLSSFQLYSKCFETAILNAKAKRKELIE